MLQDNYIGICSQAAKGRYLQARKRGGPQRLCFFSSHWGIWEQWKVRDWSAACLIMPIFPAIPSVRHSEMTAKPLIVCQCCMAVQAALNVLCCLRAAEMRRLLRLLCIYDA